MVKVKSYRLKKNLPKFSDLANETEEQEGNKEKRRESEKRSGA